MKKTIKAWAVVNDQKEIDAVWAFPSDWGGIGGCNFLIFETKREAKESAKYHGFKVTPCTITYNLFFAKFKIDFIAFGVYDITDHRS